MMRQLAAFWILLLDIRYAAVQAQTAIWKFPTQGETIYANIIDTVLLDWTSTLPSTILRMWCLNETTGNSFDLASIFYVDSTGPFRYILESCQPDETVFPLFCHPELAADPLGSGFISPGGIVWSSNLAQQEKTITHTQAASSVTVTAVLLTPSPSSTLPSPLTVSTTNANLSHASTTHSATTTRSKSQVGLSGTVTAPRQSTTPLPSSGPNNNTGAKIGGAIGGVALLSFVVLALYFLHKYRRKHASPSSVSIKPLKRSFHISGVYKRRGATHTTGIFEKEGDNGTYGKQGVRLQVHEMQGSMALEKTVSRIESGVDGEGDDAIRCSPVELPGGSDHFRDELQ
ncbi:hypothetical protein F5884DRAFT_897640 [Xylogone sp. PMI_703]|nr:hypothetical protein F5884DRAFT_897640 [Xylogone sp. PMI_703]